MTVYVDDMAAPYRGMIMFHMVADTKAELIDMALSIGVHPKHIQKEGTYQEHFDICKAKRAEAIRRGAIEIDRAGLAAILKARRLAAANPVLSQIIQNQ
jgi:hypothetical protein